jgi:hypothetical protein
MLKIKYLTHSQKLLSCFFIFFQPVLKKILQQHLNRSQFWVELRRADMYITCEQTLVPYVVIGGCVCKNVFIKNATTDTVYKYFAICTYSHFY